MNSDGVFSLFAPHSLQDSISSPAIACKHWFAATTAFLILICCQSAFALDLTGTQARNFVLKDSDGKTRALADFQGEPVLLFFGDEREPSQKGFSDLAGIADHYLGSELNIIALALNKNAAQAAEFQEALWLTYPLYGEADSKLAKAFGVTQGPQVVFLDSKHVVRHATPYRDEASLKKTLFGLMEEKVFVVTARQFEYEPNIITVNKGDKVLIKLLSEDVSHGIFIDGYEKYVLRYLDREGQVVPPEKADHHIMPGEMGIVRFVADKSGRFSIRCAVTCASFHPYMYGWLRVRPNSRFPIAVLLALVLAGLSLVLFSKEKNLGRIWGLISLQWRFELTRYRFVRSLLRSRWPRYLAVMFTTFVFTVILVSCYVGMWSAGNYNFGIMMVWIVWFVLLIMVMVPLFSRIFCSVCPLPFFGLWLQRRSLMKVKQKQNYTLNKKFPKSLSNLWMVNFLFMGVTFFNGFLTTLPIASFIMFAGIIVAATVVMFVYERRTWCRYVCPVGGFQGLYSNLAVTEIRCKDPEECNRIKAGKDYTFDNGIAACRLACPAGVDSSSYVALIAKGQYERALEVVREAMPFPGICGRVCPAPCEEQCSRGKVDSPISIRALKRFVADYAGYGAKGKNEPFVPTRDGKVAVVGSGPVGLTAAYYLAKSGHDVTVYEALPVIGGMFRVGIPDFHLPKDVVDKEIECVRAAGVRFVTDTRIGRDISFEELRKQYQAVFIAVGACISRRLQIEGENLQGVLHAVELLQRVHLGKDVKFGEKVVVVGGGKTAMDVARVSLRLGARDVTCVEMRSPKDSPPMNRQAEEEGVKIRYLTMPVKIVDSEGRANAVLCATVQVGKNSPESGQPNMAPEAGSEYLLPADTVIVATGQYSDIDFLPAELRAAESATVVVDPETMATGLPGVFAGGDVATGPNVFVNAVMQGRKAAVSIRRYLAGEPLEPTPLVPTTRQVEDLPLHSIGHKERIEPACLAVSARAGNFKEVELGFTGSEAVAEAERCLGCGVCGNCYRGNEKGYGCPWLELPFRMRRNTYCGMCLECFKTCPEDNMALNLRPPMVDAIVDEKREFGEAWKNFIMLGAAVIFYVFMMGPWGFLKDWQRAKTVLGLFKYIAISAAFALLVLPAVYGAFAWLTRRVAKGGMTVPFKTLFLNYSYSLLPLGLMTWVAFCFGFLLPSGSYVIAVLSDPFAWGWNLFGTADFPWTPFLTYWMPYLQIAALSVGLVSSIDVGLKISRRMFADAQEAVRRFLPIGAFIVLWTVVMLGLFLW